MRTLLAIPVFNEARHIEAVLGRCRRYVASILVVDDGSTDATPRLLDGHDHRPGFQRIRHPENRGYGASLHSAFRYAICRHYDWLITIDCDGQHDPAQIPDFLDAAAEDCADIISGSRYLDRSRPGDTPPPDRREINRDITALLNESLGLALTDAFCGFKAYRVEALRRLEITIPGYAMPLQLWVQAVARGLRIREIAVRLIYNDPRRHFGGMLDDPATRRQHYLETLVRELAAQLPLPGRDREWTSPQDSHPLC